MRIEQFFYTSKNAEVVTFQSGKQIVKTSGADNVSTGKKDEQGNYINKSIWFTIQAWPTDKPNNVAARLAKVPKGTLIYVKGVLDTNEYTGKDGTTKTELIITLDAFDGLRILKGEWKNNELDVLAAQMGAPAGGAPTSTATPPAPVAVPSAAPVAVPGAVNMPSMPAMAPIPGAVPVEEFDFQQA